MMHLRQTNPDLEQGPEVISALRSLTRQQADVITQALSTVPGGWQSECHDDYEGYLSILVSGPEADPESPSYLISGKVRC